jgi:hypothetical protein
LDASILARLRPRDLRRITTILSSSPCCQATTTAPAFAEDVGDAGIVVFEIIALTVAWTDVADSTLAVLSFDKRVAETGSD